jgi:ribosome-binding factor A
MSSRRPSRKDIRLLCDSVGPEDGIDPRYLRKPSGQAPRRKTLQLCSQAREALVGALAGCADGALRDLSVVAVTPAGGGRLLVTLRPNGADPATARDHLARAHGLLRREVAAAVHRRKAPDLVFQVLVPNG